jgi:ABC-type antimicrobial peptide transport system permease subunit
MARLDSPSRARDVYQTVRDVDSPFILKLDFVDDIYAGQFADRLLAARVVGAFGTLAFGVAVAGIHGVMLLLVAQRRREIGIRMALGADATRVRSLVLGASLRLSAVGRLLGMLAAVAASRWVQSQLFGVHATDPATLLGVALIVSAAAALATWPAVHQAAHVDPNLLLKE